jgi:hypothetical protein
VAEAAEAVGEGAEDVGEAVEVGAADVIDQVF